MIVTETEEGAKLNAHHPNNFGTRHFRQVQREMGIRNTVQPNGFDEPTLRQQHDCSVEVWALISVLSDVWCAQENLSDALGRSVDLNFNDGVDHLRQHRYLGDSGAAVTVDV